MKQPLMNQDIDPLSSWYGEIDRAVRESRAFCIALFSGSGEILFANPAMTELLGETPCASFVHPTFEKIAEAGVTERMEALSQKESAEPVFAGFLTLKKDSQDTSIYTRVYRRDDQLLLVGEIDVTSLTREYRTVVELNRENTRLQRDLLKQKHLLQQEVEKKKRSEARVQKLLEEKEVILREVHHRIKNNMNTVVSVLQLQEQLHEDETTSSVLQDAAQRIRSMMLLYDKLYQSSQVDAMAIDRYLLPLVKQVLGVFPHGASIQLHTEIPPIKMKAKVLSTLGIIVYEIVTNAMKYAFADRGEGTLTLTAHQEKSAVSISIADDGPGLPEQPSNSLQEGFGMTLVNALVEQLNGTLRTENENGARVVLTFETEE